MFFALFSLFKGRLFSWKYKQENVRFQRFPFGEPGGIHPFAQWSRRALGADSSLPFAPTNSGRLPSALPTGKTLPSFAHDLLIRSRDITVVQILINQLSQPAKISKFSF